MAIAAFQEYPKIIYTDKEKKNYIKVNSKEEEDALTKKSDWPPKKDFKAD